MDFKSDLRMFWVFFPEYFLNSYKLFKLIQALLIRTEYMRERDAAISNLHS